MYGRDDTRVETLLPKRLSDRVPLVAPGTEAAPAVMVAEIQGLMLRLGALPGVHAELVTSADGETVMDFYIDADYLIGTIRDDPCLLCGIGSQGIDKLKLLPEDANEVVRKQWGTATDETLRIYLPRDAIEMEMIWRIILLAYQFRTLRSPRTVNRVLPQVATATRSWA
jgi:hypothetical protein